MRFIKTKFYVSNIRQTGKLKPKIKTIISSISHAFVKLEETGSEIPIILSFDVMKKFTLGFFSIPGTKNSETQVCIFLLTKKELKEIVETFKANN